MQIIVRFARFVRKKKYCFCFCWAWYYFRILDVQKPKLGWIFAMLFYQKLSCFPWLHKTSVLDLSNKWSIPQSILQKQTAVFLLAKKSRLKGSRPQPANLHKLSGRTKFSRKFINRSNFHSGESPAKYIPRSQLKPYGVNFEHPKWLSFDSFFDPPEVFGCNSSWNSSQPSWTTCNTSAGTRVRKTPSDRNWGKPVFQPPKWTQNAFVLKDVSCFALVGCWKETFSSCIFL